MFSSCYSVPRASVWCGESVDSDTAETRDYMTTQSQSLQTHVTWLYNLICTMLLIFIAMPGLIMIYDSRMHIIVKGC